MQETLDNDFYSILAGKSRIESAGEKIDECNGCVPGRKVSVFHIVQGTIGDMGLKLAAQGIVGIVAEGVAVDEQLGEGLEVGDVFPGIDFAWDKDIEEVPFFFVCKVGIQPMEHL